MRTTIAIDDDVLLAVKDRALRERRSAGEVLSDLARQALTQGYEGSGEPVARFGFRPFPHRGGTVSNAVVNRLRDEEVV
ncbi:MAG: CopG family transcriptional regulator [Acidimicrobiales bacterium]